MGDAINFFELISPIIIAIVLVLLQFFINDQEKKLKIELSFLNTVSIEKNISSTLMVRSVLLILTVFSLSVPAFRDYTKYFPTHLSMDVFFDNSGLKDSLSQFTSQELTSLGVRQNWINDKREYLERLNADVKAETKHAETFIIDDQYIQSKGNTVFRVNKIKGWQKYHINEAQGLLNYTFQEPKKSPVGIDAEFILLNKKSNYIDVNLSDIYIKFTKIIKPEFKQLAVYNATKKVFNHDLIAVTKIRFFPIVNIGHTIYFIRMEDDSLVPVAYCIYQPH